MFVCLSSGASPRYRQDILRALGMPHGASLQFRYQSKWIAPSVFGKVKDGKIINSRALVAYVDQSIPGQAPELIPCRFASISEASIHGTTVSLVLNLGEIALATNLQAFNTEMRTQSSGTLPSWQSGSLVGHYWFEVLPGPTTVTASENISDWETVVSQLATHTEFSNEGGFYAVLGMSPLESAQTVQFKKGRYELASGTEYELRIYHYSPGSSPLDTRLTLATSSPWLMFTTNPLLMLDSRYDLKRVRIKTGKPSSTEPAILCVLRSEGATQTPELQFDLPVAVRSNFGWTLLYGAVLGVLLAGPQIIAAFSNPTLPRMNAYFISLMSGVLGLFAGIFAAFGLKKSPE